MTIQSWLKTFSIPTNGRWRSSLSYSEIPVILVKWQFLLSLKLWINLVQLIEIINNLWYSYGMFIVHFWTEKFKIILCKKWTFLPHTSCVTLWKWWMIILGDASKSKALSLSLLLLSLLSLLLQLFVITIIATVSVVVRCSNKFMRNNYILGLRMSYCSDFNKRTIYQCKSYILAMLCIPLINELNEHPYNTWRTIVCPNTLLYVIIVMRNDWVYVRVPKCAENVNAWNNKSHVKLAALIARQCVEIDNF